ncbi:hypothetical protein JW868_01750 [Candidatus Woesearchaeota archaeon]|nr:hypothetical protein [Candidatus Woesearchaeota archaeon]
MLSKELVLKIVEGRGPIQPNEIKKVVGAGDNFLIGAILSQLSNAGQIRVSHTKHGSSPFYYSMHNKNKLENLVPYLNEKDQRTARLLKEKGVVADESAETLIRVSLRNIRDFAIPLQVNVNGQPKLYWKYFTLPSEEAENKIRELLGMTKQMTAPEAVLPASTQSSVPIEPVAKLAATATPIPEPQVKEAPKQTVETSKQDIVKAEPAKQKTLPEQPAQGIRIDASSDFGKKIASYFSRNNIKVVEENILRKGSDMEYIVRIPSAVGALKFWCKAKSKKTCNDADLSSAYVQGEMKKMPVLYLTAGKVTKKAREMLLTQFKTITLKEL